MPSTVSPRHDTRFGSQPHSSNCPLLGLAALFIDICNEHHEGGALRQARAGGNHIDVPVLDQELHDILDVRKTEKQSPVYDKSFACGKMAAECMWLSVGGSASNHAS